MNKVNNYKAQMKCCWEYCSGVQFLVNYNEFNGFYDKWIHMCILVHTLLINLLEKCIKKVLFVKSKKIIVIFNRKFALQKWEISNFNRIVLFFPFLWWASPTTNQRNRVVYVTFSSLTEFLFAHYCTVFCYALQWLMEWEKTQKVSMNWNHKKQVDNSRSKHI